MATYYIYEANTGWVQVSGTIASPLTTKGDLYGYSTTDARIPVGTDGYYLQADSTQPLGVKWAAGSSAGVSSLDSITGAVTLVAGSNVTITDNSPSAGDITIAASGGGGVTEYDYAQITSPVTITGTSGSQQTIITGNAVTYDGSTRIKVEFNALAIGQSTVAANTGTNALITIWDGSTNLGVIAQVDLSGDTLSSPNTLTFNIPAYGAVFLTPSAGSHTFYVKGWQTAGAPIVRCGSGGTGDAPAWYRITAA